MDGDEPREPIGPSGLSKKGFCERKSSGHPDLPCWLTYNDVEHSQMHSPSNSRPRSETERRFDQPRRELRIEID